MVLDHIVMQGSHGNENVNQVSMDEHAGLTCDSQMDSVWEVHGGCFDDGKNP